MAQKTRPRWTLSEYMARVDRAGAPSRLLCVGDCKADESKRHSADPALLGEQPAHVRVERYVSQSALLPHCHVVVSHAGSGTAMSALELGLPQLCLPQGADQFVNAAAISSAGAAISLVPAEATASAVPAAIVRLLDDASYREAAERLSASIAAMPSPDDVCAVLEKML